MKKTDILQMPSIAYYSGFSGLEVKKIEYGEKTYMYCVSGAWTGNKKPHKLKVNENKQGKYIRLHGYTCPLQDFIRMGVLV